MGDTISRADLVEKNKITTMLGNRMHMRVDGDRAAPLMVLARMPL